MNEALNKYHITADNIPSPFIALLIQQDDKKMLIDSGIGYTEKPVVVRGNSVVFKGRLHQLLLQENIKKRICLMWSSRIFIPIILVLFFLKMTS